MKWTAEYDEDTGRHRVYSGDGELIAEVGNVAMGYSRQSALARAIADMRDEIVARSQATPAE